MSERRLPWRPTWVVALSTLVGGAASAGEPGSAGACANGAATLSRLPLDFVENRGQWGSPARFVARRGGMTARIEEDGVVLQLTRRRDEDRLEGVVVRLRFEGALETVAIEGEGKQPGLHNFFLGNDPSGWRTDVPAYSSVLYRGLQEGVDLRLREQEGRLEYDLILAQGADPGGLVVRCEGIEGLSVGPDGSLAMGTALGPIRQSPPLAWQALAGDERRPIEARFRAIGTDRFGFEVPGRDPSLPLVIDPGILYSTFLGGTGNEFASCLALDPSGAITVAGRTSSLDFPTTAGAYDPSPGLNEDAFVARLSSSGGALLYSTFLGGAGLDFAGDLALDASGSATVTGQTASPDFPATAGTYDPSYNGGPDAFVARLSPSGGSLLYSTFLGGTGYELAPALALDGSGAACVAGQTGSPGFPTTPGAYDSTFSGGFYDLFVSRLSPSGGSLLDSTFLGGAGDDVASSLATDPSGAAIVAGKTGSPDFPTTPGAVDPTYNGGLSDAFVARLSSSGGNLLDSTFLGGGGPDSALALALDPSGAIAVTGDAGSPDFPTTPGAYDPSPNPGGGDIFVARISPAGGSLLASTFLGGMYGEFASSLAVDSSGAVTVAGMAGAADFPTTPGAYDTGFNGGGAAPSDAFVARLSPSAGSLLYSTFLGGTDADQALAVVLDAFGVATVAGLTYSPYFPTTSGALDTSHNGGGGDVFVARLDLLPTGASPYGTSTPGCAGPLVIGVNSIPKIWNSSFAVTCLNAPPNSSGLFGFSSGGLAAPLYFGGIGAWINPFAPFFIHAIVPSDAVGAAEVPIPIPLDLSLEGLQVFVQFVWPDGCAPGGFSASNALALTVQP